jgi:CHAT domain-containing protein
VAGARSTLLSLWKVDDEATAWFMRRYYEQLKGGRGRMDALLAVQKEFRTRPKLPGWSHPIYWAAWQLTGDGAALSK